MDSLTTTLARFSQSRDHHMIECCILIGWAKFFYLITYVEELQNGGHIENLARFETLNPSYFFAYVSKCL